MIFTSIEYFLGFWATDIDFLSIFQKKFHILFCTYSFFSWDSKFFTVGVENIINIFNTLHYCLNAIRLLLSFYQICPPKNLDSLIGEQNTPYYQCIHIKYKRHFSVQHHINTHGLHITFYQKHLFIF